MSLLIWSILAPRMCGAMCPVQCVTMHVSMWKKTTKKNTLMKKRLWEISGFWFTAANTCPPSLPPERVRSTPQPRSPHCVGSAMSYSVFNAYCFPWNTFLHTPRGHQVKPLCEVWGMWSSTTQNTGWKKDPENIGGQIQFKSFFLPYLKKKQKTFLLSACDRNNTVRIVSRIKDIFHTPTSARAIKSRIQTTFLT